MTARLALHAAGSPVVGEITDLVIAGWAGRDPEAVGHHVEELQRLGVKPPREAPLFYRVSASVLTTANAIDVAGRGSTGEAEAVLLSLPSGLWVAVGSDHTDRQAEAAGVTWSKQMCAKPIGPELWHFEDVKPHWDVLRLSARVLQNGSWQPYQHGTLDGLRTPSDLVHRYDASGTLACGTAMFLGTIPVVGTLAWADEFELTLEDPVLGRQLSHSYKIRSLPLAD